MSSGDFSLTVMSGAGNTFALIDGFTSSWPRDPAALAIDLCASRDHVTLDGLILVGPSTKDADCTMWIFNADGSRPETCGNGLRCVAKLVAERGHVHGDSFTIQTDAGVRACTVFRRNGRVDSARVNMGAPKLVAKERELVVKSGVLTATIVEIGNPHCVLIVDDERTASVTALGPEIESLDVFPRGVNVGFLACRREGAFLRVWERGVGETRACGSGACAAAYTACMKGILGWPVRLTLPGGVLEVDSDEHGGLVLTGPVEECGSITSPLPTALRAARIERSLRPSHVDVDATGTVLD